MLYIYEVTFTDRLGGSSTPEVEYAFASTVAATEYVRRKTMREPIVNNVSDAEYSAVSGCYGIRARTIYHAADEVMAEKLRDLRASALSKLTSAEINALGLSEDN